MKTDQELFYELREIANAEFDGHFAVLKFTTNWRVCFGTPDTSQFEGNVHHMPAGATFREAAEKAIATKACAWPDEDEGAA